MRQLILLTAVLVCLAGCAKKSTAKLPPVPLVFPPARTAPAPVEFPAPPEVSLDSARPLPQMSAPIPNVPKPQVPTRPRVVQKKDSRPAGPPKPAGQGFQLGEVLTAAQQADLTAQIDSFMRTAERTVRVASSRVLNPEQSSLLNQLRIIVDQARNARAVDLVEARKLAERARNLAEALTRSGL